MSFFQRLFGQRGTAAAPTPVADVAPSPPSTLRDRVRTVISNPRGDGDAPAMLLPSGPGYVVEVVGESHYQEALLRTLVNSSWEREQGLLLLPEPENQHDPRAVRVTTFKLECLGYLPAAVAALYQPVLLKIVAEGVYPIVSGKLVGGTGKKSIGVYLDVAGPPAIARECGFECP